MTVYQARPHVFYFNHAHNEYLQLVAEGGLVLAVPAAIALASAAWLIWRRLAADRTAVFWVRAGAASGLLAIAVQSVWDTALRIPANGVLCALLAAIAMHDGSTHPSDGEHRRHHHHDHRHDGDDVRRNHLGAPRTIREM
jgi:O-antigen ligase